MLESALLQSESRATTNNRHSQFTTRNYWILAPLATLSFSLLVAYVYLVGSIAMAHAFDPEPVLQAVRIEKVINAVTGYADVSVHLVHSIGVSLMVILGSH